MTACLVEARAPRQPQRMKSDPGDRRESIVAAFLRLLEEWHGRDESAARLANAEGDRARSDNTRASAASSASTEGASR
jgi:hypothetical protein